LCISPRLLAGLALTVAWILAVYQLTQTASVDAEQNMFINGLIVFTKQVVTQLNETALQELRAVRDTAATISTPAAAGAIGSNSTGVDRAIFDAIKTKPLDFVTYVMASSSTTVLWLIVSFVTVAWLAVCCGMRSSSASSQPTFKPPQPQFAI
jgi:hypothetical protein